jgi:ATP/maltotriose-dependent transcriptional regulator MalT
LATSIGYYWVTRGTTESKRWFDEFLSVAADAPAIPVEAFRFRGWLSMLQIEPQDARPWLARAIAAAQDSGDLAQLVESLAMASTAEHMVGDSAAAQRLLAESEALAPNLDSYPAAVELVLAQAIDAFFEGDLSSAQAISAEGVRRSRQAGDLYRLQTFLMFQGQAGMLSGDVAGSAPWFLESLQVARQIDDRITQYVLLSVLSWHAASTGQMPLAAQLQGAAEVLGSRAGAGMTGPAMPYLARASEAAVNALGASRFEAEREVGRRLSREAALRESADAGVQASGQAAPGPLAAREVEVAKLVAEGLTNKQIGTRLFISERTVATHVRNILNKLGFATRAQIASWMSSDL